MCSHVSVYLLAHYPPIDVCRALILRGNLALPVEVRIVTRLRVVLCPQLLQLSPPYRLGNVGPTHRHLHYKNLSLDDVLAVLRAELAEATQLEEAGI